MARMKKADSDSDSAHLKDRKTQLAHMIDDLPDVYDTNTGLYEAVAT